MKYLLNSEYYSRKSLKSYHGTGYEALHLEPSACYKKNTLSCRGKKIIDGNGNPMPLWALGHMPSLIQACPLITL